MQIPVLGMDPSLLHWGLAEAQLDLNTGCLTTPVLTLIQPKEMTGKQVRKNSQDLHRAAQLGDVVIPAAQKAKIIFVEIPVGSQSARSMASYGICVGVLGAVRALGVPLIEVTATESKVIFTGDHVAPKAKMIARAVELYPDSNFPMHGGKMIAKAEHVADALAAIHAGVKTPMFQNLLRLFKGL